VWGKGRLAEKKNVIAKGSSRLGTLLWGGGGHERMPVRNRKIVPCSAEKHKFWGRERGLPTISAVESENGDGTREVGPTGGVRKADLN